MKKFLSVFFAICLVASLTSCSTNNVPNTGSSSEGTSDIVSDEASASSTPAKEDDTSFGLNDTASFKNINITALKMEESTGDDFFSPEDGNIFVGINFEIENISDETQAMSSLLLFDAYVDDVKCSYSLSANVAFDEGTLDGEISAGKKMVGWYALEVPQDWQKIELEVKSNWLSNKKATFVFSK